ncbi:FAD-dependent monooxygenase [Duganella sp. HH105]|uniref:FAD-dependent monooxygenase n=1 Tax=Duganella sp. HH105 TaxID=1781067 RepID=UPI000877B58C|nr:FAD-dependent monooxygenase [Duganella sp. HH105]OEZ55488.1 pentachlorophenol 4-monooxygenase [Duganella sp. HH105]
MNARVLIVGAGPVGLFVGTELAKYGIAADIIEKNNGGNSYSKALSVSAASLKAFHGLGLQQEFAGRGKPIQEIAVHFNGKRCARIDKRKLGGLYDYYLSVPQPETESLIRLALERANGKVDYGHELTQLEQDANGVAVAIRDAASGQLSNRHYEMVIGCDGAQSSVRQLLKMPFEGYDYDVHFIMGDVYFDGAVESEMTSYHVYDEGFLIFLPMDNGLTRLVVSKPGPLPANRPLPDQEELQFFLDKYYPRPLRIKQVVWSSSARFFNRLAASNHVGRVFLAGDAFHLFSPIGGQGMNTGIQDAANLGWKIAFYLKGAAKPELLQSYRRERYIAVGKAADLTGANTELILRRGGAEHMRWRYTPAMSNRAFYRRRLSHDFSGLLADHNIESSSLVGRHVPYCARSDGLLGLQSTYDIPKLGRNVLFCNDGVADAARARLERYLHVVATGALADDDHAWRTALHLDRHDACLVRPDGYVGFCGSLDELEQYLDRLYH